MYNHNIMDQTAKIEQKSQQVIIHQNLQIEQASSSQPIFRNTRKGTNPHKKSNKSSCRLQFQKSNWLVGLIKLNPSKMTEIMAMANDLLNIFTEVETKRSSIITSINFENIYANQQSYHVFLTQIDKSFVCMKIRDSSGFIVCVKIWDKEDKLRELLSILKKMGDKLPVFIYDYTQDASYISSLNQSSNIVFILKKQLTIPTTLRKIQQQRYFFYYNTKIKKAINLSKLIYQFGQIESQQKGKIRQMFAPYEQDLDDDTQALVSNLMLTGSNIFRNKIVQILMAGLDTLNKHIICWRENNNHYPGSSEKKECYWCKRKRTEAICNGCTLIYKKQIHLCIKNCFEKHHEANSMFMRTEKEQICNNINFIDAKYYQVGKIMDNLAKQHNPQFLQFLTYLRTKMISSFSKVAARANQDQIQKND